MSDEKPKKARKPAAPKPPASVESLISHALKLAATNAKASWSGKSAAALFNTNEVNHEAAITAATKGDTPLLTQFGKGGVLTAAGFEKIASTLPDDQVAALAKVVAAGMAAGERAGFLSAVIGRTHETAAELTPLIEEATAAAKIEHDARVALATKRATAHAANEAALERALALSRQAKQDRIDAIRREWEAEGQRAADLPTPTKNSDPEPESQHGAKKRPLTNEDKAFQRATADQLASSWRAAFDGNKAEGLEFVESAMWNIAGLTQKGAVGAVVAFEPYYHESPTPISTGASVTVVRPGWVLEERTGDYVPLKVLVKRA